MIDFTHVVDFIFKNKEKYKILTNDNKENFFFIINRKFARNYPFHAQLFNKKYIDKSNSLDIWYHFFIKKGTIGIPPWYWVKKSKSDKDKSFLTKSDIEYLKNFYDIKENDIKFLEKYHNEELLSEIKKLRKYYK